MRAAAGRGTRGSGGGIRARIGHQIGDSSTLPQVTALALKRIKIARVFEFMSLTGAPGRVRTCAHGSGGLLCIALTSRNMLAEVLSGRVSGAATWPGWRHAVQYLLYDKLKT
jgi:hypothetical protein